MKCYMALFSWSPGDEEQSVIFANNLDEAKSFVLKELEEKKYEIIFVDSYPLNARTIGYLKRECRIQEVPIKEGVIYTGNFCC